MANDALQKYDGTPTTVIATTGTIADGIFTVASTNATITEFDNSVDLWPTAVATLKIPDTFAVAPDAGSSIDLFMCAQDLAGDAGDDVTPPTTTDKKNADYVGSFQPIHNTDEDQPMQIVISLLGVRKAKFYIQNNTGQTISYSAGNTVEIEGLTLTPST